MRIDKLILITEIHFQKFESKILIRTIAGNSKSRVFKNNTGFGIGSRKACQCNFFSKSTLVKAIDISKVVNLKHAWEFILGEGVITYPTNYAILCQINEIVEEGFSYTAGRIRSVPVSVGGSTYIPPIPYEPQVKEDLSTLLSKDASYDVAIELLLYVMKKQLYLDGNKRTTVIFANHYLISRGMGLIVIPAELVSEFKGHLIKYYEENDISIKDFLYDKCLTKIL